MNGCCAVRSEPRTAPGRAAGLGASLLPAVLWMVLPKCPVCLAAWLAVATGIGFEAGDVGWIRAGLIALWAATAGWWISRRALRWVRIHRSIPPCAIVD